MPGPSTMMNFPSSLRMNFAGEIVQDEAILPKEKKTRLREERKQLQKKSMKQSSKETWFRFSKNKRIDDKKMPVEKHAHLDGFFTKMELFVCGPAPIDTIEKKKRKKRKKRRLPILTIHSKTETEKQNSKGKNRKSKNSKQEHATWFQQPINWKKPQAEEKSIFPQMIADLIKKEETRNGPISAWVRTPTRPKKEGKPSQDESNIRVDLRPLSDLIARLIKREEDKNPATGDEPASKSKEFEFEENEEESIDGGLRIWYERLKSEGEGYIRFVSQCNGTSHNNGSHGNFEDVQQDDKLYIPLDPSLSLGAGTGSMTSTSRSDDDSSLSSASESSDYSSYEVPSLFQEIKSLKDGFRLSYKSGVKGCEPPPRELDKNQGSNQEDQNYLVRNLQCSERMEDHPENILVLETRGAESSDHGFKVQLHENRAVCEV